MAVGALPRGLTSFIGRETELRELSGLLASIRLLTISGAGGVGKTRLAAEVGLRAASAHRDGACWVDLAPLAEAEFLPVVVLRALGIGEAPGEPPTELLLEHLRGRQLLLLLDNCEHLAGACAGLAARLLPACPELRILTTSRERLGVEGEVVWRVPPLGFPDSDETIRLTDLTRYGALRLFIERARAVEPRFQVEDQNLRAVAQICRQLDGIPLAIELAAAWTRALSVEQIAERLATGLFQVLRDPNRGVRPRHRTLRAAIDWSHDLLVDAERTVLRRLAAFSGGATLAAAEAVCGLPPLVSTDVLDVLAALGDKSLVVVSTIGDETRYRLLEPIRQYAHEWLVASGEADVVRRAHRDWSLALAERAAPELTGGDQLVWLDRLGRDHDNLRAALAWSLAAVDGGGEALRIAAALGRFWHYRGGMSEGREWLERALARADEAPPAARALAFMWAGQFQRVLGHGSGERSLLERAVAEARLSGDLGVLATTLRHFGYTLNDLDDREGARAAFAEALELARQLGDENVVTRCLGTYGRTLWLLGERESGRQHLEESVARARRAGDPGFLGQVLGYLGGVLVIEGELARAQALLVEGREAARVSNQILIGPISVWLADIALRRGDVAAAAELCREALAGHRVHRRHGYVGAVIRRIAWLLVLRGDHTRAARLLGATPATPTLGIYPDYELPGGADAGAAARARLGDEAFELAYREGQSLSVEEAMTLVDDTLDRALATPPSSPAPNPLSAREAEVAALVARGRSNREIAADLVIAESTADRHLANIFNKLGLHSRAELAAWHERHARASATDVPATLPAR